MSYVKYSQNDAKWKNLKLGTSSWTMGQAGCFVTSMSVVATNLGHSVTPAQMLSLLEKHGLINNQGDISGPDALCKVFPDLTVTSKTWPSQKADLSFLGVNTIIEIDDSPSSGMQTHFMPVIKVSGNDVQVMDVWDGVIRNVSAYGARWNPPVSAAAIIYGAWKYSKKPAPKPVITTKDVTTTKSIPFAKKTVNDPTLPKGQSKTTPGKNGIETIVTTITYTDGKQTASKVKSDKVTTPPITQVTTIGTKEQDVTQPVKKPVVAPPATETPTTPPHQDTPVTQPVPAPPKQTPSNSTPPPKSPAPAQGTPKVIVPDPAETHSIGQWFGVLWRIITLWFKSWK